MSKVIRHAVIYTGSEKIEDGYVRFNRQIEAVGRMSDYVCLPTDSEVIDAEGRILVPGFIDVHSHGGYGFDTMDGDADEIDEMVNHMVCEGVTTYFATTMTQSHQNIEKALAAAREAAKKNPVIQGIHLEGPFVSPVFKGAQPEQYIEAPDVELFDHWNKISGNMIRLVTYAPEHGTSPAFEQYCLEHNIVPSAGHSNATREQMKHSRATHITHLYNAQREFKHREPGVTGHALLEDNIRCEMIADGFHVCPDMIRLAYKLKGADKIDLITDSMRAKGMPEGVSELGGQKVIVKDRQARLEDGTLAGSVLLFKDAFVNIMKFTGCGIEEAVKMSSVNQAREFGLTSKGAIEAGKDADFNLFNDRMELEATYSYGRLFKN